MPKCPPWAAFGRQHYEYSLLPGRELARVCDGVHRDRSDASGLLGQGAGGRVFTSSENGRMIEGFLAQHLRAERSLPDLSCRLECLPIDHRSCWASIVEGRRSGMSVRSRRHWRVATKLPVDHLRLTGMRLQDAARPQRGRGDFFSGFICNSLGRPFPNKPSSQRQYSGERKG